MKLMEMEKCYTLLLVKYLPRQLVSPGRAVIIPWVKRRMIRE